MYLRQNKKFKILILVLLILSLTNIVTAWVVPWTIKKVNIVVIILV